MEDLSTHGVVALVRDKENKFLLLKEARILMKDYWSAPHGRCQLGDQSEEAAVVRETREEVGISVVPVKKVLTQAADTKVKTVSFWIVTADEYRVRLNEESSDFGWFTVDEALDIQLYPGTRIFFEKVKSGEVNID